MKTFGMQGLLLSLLLVACGGGGGGNGGSGDDEGERLPIENASFEALALDDIQFTVPAAGVFPCPGNAFCVPNADPIPGWTFSPADASVGSWNVTPDFFFDDAPRGDDVAFIIPAAAQDPRISQVLTSTLEANTRYTLRVDVGQRRDVVFAEYGIELRAGAALLAEDDNSFMPPTGEFLRMTVEFETGDVHPNLGEALEIRLTANATGAPGAQVSFDDVRLTATELD